MRHIQLIYLRLRRLTFLILSFLLLRAWDLSLPYGIRIGPSGVSGWICKYVQLSDTTALICLSTTPKDLSDCPPDIQSIYDTALNHIRASRLTDAEFIYTPSQIALAALSLASPHVASAWSMSKIQPNPPSSLLSEATLPTITEAIKTLITSAGFPPNVESVREVDRRLKLCKNPEKVVGSSAYLARKAEEEKKAEQKRNKKAGEVHQAMVDGDPFGNELEGRRPGLVDYDDDDDDDD